MISSASELQAVYGKSQDFCDASDEIQATLQKFAEHEVELKRSGVEYPDDDYKPWVIIVDSMCTRQAWQVGPILAAHGVHGVFQSGQLAEQLAGQWCHPKPPDPKARYKSRKKEKWNP